MLFKKIEIKDYQVRIKVFAILLGSLILLWSAITFFVIFNRYTYSNKRIDLRYFHSNLTDHAIDRVIPASEVTKGDNHIIENYLAEYVKVRETIIPGDFKAKDTYIRAFSENNLWGLYWQSLDMARKARPFLTRSITIQNIERLDNTLYQARYKVVEKEDYRTSEETVKTMIATIRYDFATIEKYDARAKIPDFDILNPLSIEVIVYTTARRLT